VVRASHQLRICLGSDLVMNVLLCSASNSTRKLFPILRGVVNQLGIRMLRSNRTVPPILMCVRTAAASCFHDGISLVFELALESAWRTKLLM
jgi:hypothetical protein